MKLVLKGVLILLLASTSMNAQKNSHQDTLIVNKGKEEQKQLEECKQSFVPYENYFLRGVKEEFFVTYNKTTLAECLELCCLEKHFLCSSFSYFLATNLCYVMNLTKHDDVAQMVPFVGIIHYDKPVPTDGIPTLSSTLVATSPPTEEIAGTSSSDSSQSDTTAPIFEPTTTEHAQPKSLKSGSRKFSTTTKGIVTSNNVTTLSLAKDSAKYVETPDTPGSSYPTKILLDVPETTMKAVTGAPMENNVVVFNMDLTSKSVEDPTSYVPESSASQASCPLICQNGGTCHLKKEKSDQKLDGDNVTSECLCKSGYYGKYCEKETATESQTGRDGKSEAAASTGVPIYVIVVAVLGFLLVCLFVTLLVLYIIYRKKTGKYRVKEQRERWNKRTRKAEARRSKSFLSGAPRSPVGSALSVPGSVNSSGTHSTTTSV